MKGAGSTEVQGVGLALSGGGFAGGGAATGFACAIDLFLGSHSVADLAYYSGVSAGAIIGATLASGISPLEMIQGTFKPGSTGYRPFLPRHLYRPNWRELPTSLRRLGKRTFATANRVLRRRGHSNQPGESVLPSAILSNESLKAIIQKNLERNGKNDFSALTCRLRVIFYDLLGNERIVAGNGPGEISTIPVAEAVTASAAIPCEPEPPPDQ